VCSIAELLFIVYWIEQLFTITEMIGFDFS
jgi:hypothetical protein